MKRFPLATLLAAATAGAAPLTCPQPQYNPIGGLYLGMPLSELKAKYPGTYNRGQSMIRVNELVVRAPKEFTDVHAELAGNRAYLGTITYYLTNELDWSYQRMFNRAISDYKLPRDGWRELGRHSYQLQCGDYEIFMGEDEKLGFFMKFHLPEKKRRR